MKKTAMLLILAVLLLLCTGCGAAESGREDRVRITLEEQRGFRTARSSLLVEPGADAVFVIELENGFSLTGNSYQGESETVRDGRTVTLTFKSVDRPMRVRLELTDRYVEVTYMANGGRGVREGDAVTVTCDTLYRPRPNTLGGEPVFEREGHTLVSWNTSPDGTGLRVGLGSRVTVPEDRSLTLYAQWAEWTPAEDFTWERGEDGIVITGYHGNADPLVVPQTIDGERVAVIDTGAITGCGAETVILSPKLRYLEDGAFTGCQVRELVLFDSLTGFGDASFEDCPRLRTLRINAAEAPYGYLFRQESCYADKVDLLIMSEDRNRLVFYGGCSMWYNLNGDIAAEALGDEYLPVNMGLNGTVVSTVQLQIMGHFLHEGDVLFHTPEISSKQQLLINVQMSNHDMRLWCGLENNYDLFSLVDLQTTPGVFNSLRFYLGIKKDACAYSDSYEDENGTYMDRWGCVPFYRERTKGELMDDIFLDKAYISPPAMARLQEYYDWFAALGVRVYVSCAPVDLDEVPEEQRGDLELINSLFRESIEFMNGPVVVSNMRDYVYPRQDFFDTNYHLLSAAAEENTRRWMADLIPRMERDGLLHKSGNSAETP